MLMTVASHFGIRVDDLTENFLNIEIEQWFTFLTAKADEDTKLNYQIGALTQAVYSVIDGKMAKKPLSDFMFSTEEYKPPPVKDVIAKLMVFKNIVNADRK